LCICNCRRCAFIIVAQGSALCGAIGLFLSRLWGYIGVYIFIPIACYGLGISAVPFVVNLIPVNFKTAALITLSIAFLAVTISLQISKAVNSKKQIGIIR
jgi:hypothetical protein